MDAYDDVVEVTLVRGRILVTFRDGKVAIIHPSKLRPFASDVISIREALEEDLRQEGH